MNQVQDISYRNIARVSLPIIISGLSTAIFQITDTAFLGHVNETAIGAVGNAGLLYFVLVHVGMGFSTGAQIIIGRRNGEKRTEKIGALLQHTWYFLIPLSVLFFIALHLYTPYFFRQIIHSDAILQLAEGYMTWRIPGIFFAFLNLGFMAFYIGTTQTRILSISTPIAVGINIILDYALIFGKLGLPEMGVEGAALASVISEVCTTVIFIFYTLIYVNHKAYALFPFKINALSPYILLRIFRTGGPVMAQNFLSIASWYAFFSILEHLGERALAVSHIVRSIYMFVMIPVFGFAVCTNTLTSNLIGQGESGKIIPLIMRTWKLATGWNIIMLLCILLFHKNILAFFTNDYSLADAATGTLHIISMAMFLFSFAMMHFSAITGSGRTMHALIIEAISIFVYLAFTFYAVEIKKASVEVAWSSEFVYFSVFSFLSAYYIRSRKWMPKEL